MINRIRKYFNNIYWLEIVIIICIGIYSLIDISKTFIKDGHSQIISSIEQRVKPIEYFRDYFKVDIKILNSNEFYMGFQEQNQVENENIYINKNPNEIGRAHV